MSPENKAFKEKLKKFLDDNGVYISSYDIYNNEHIYVGTNYYLENDAGTISINIASLT